MDLKQEWLNLTSKYNSDESISHDIFSKIEKNYSSKKRAYHTTKHIEALLKVISEFSDKISELDSIKFAVWFHDVIYKAWRKDNEEKSSDLAISSLKKLGVDKIKIEKTSKLILLTKSHDSSLDDFDEKIFIDADLSILGVDNNTYEQYSKNIRKEYFFVPENIYKKGRIAVINSFLQKESIYKTDEMIAKFESSARINLEKELNFLML